MVISLTNMMSTPSLARYRGSGDIVVSSGVQQGLDRSLPENRTFYEVQERYFSPHVDRDMYWAVLVVKARKGMPHEAPFFNN